MYTYDIPLTVTATEAGLRRLCYQNKPSRRAILTFQIPSQRITHDSVKVDPPAPRVKHRAAVQVAPGAHIEAAFQRTSALRPSASQSAR